MDRLIDKMLAPLRRKVSMMVARGVLSLINDAGGRQVLQVQLLAGELADGAESFDHYGFTSVPLPGAEGIYLSVGGERTHGVVIATGDRRYRLRNLQSGEVAIYDDLGHQVYLSQQGIVINGAGQNVTVMNTPLMLVESNLHVTGDILDNCNSQSDTVAGMRVKFNGHNHGGVQTGGGSTSGPNVQE